ncbi:MAG: DRTGG domain-containing protein [Halanaerobiales bacterium]
MFLIKKKRNGNRFLKIKRWIKIKVNDLINIMEIEVINLNDGNREITGGYTGDLLSNVMANADTGDIWITIQGHQNAVAVALLVEISAIIIAENSEIEDKAIKRAEEKGINLLRSPLSAFEIAGKLYNNGITP